MIVCIFKLGYLRHRHRRLVTVSRLCNHRTLGKKLTINKRRWLCVSYPTLTRVYICTGEYIRNRACWIRVTWGSLTWSSASREQVFGQYNLLKSDDNNKVIYVAFLFYVPILRDHSDYIYIYIYIHVCVRARVCVCMCALFLSCHQLAVFHVNSPIPDRMPTSWSIYLSVLLMFFQTFSSCNLCRHSKRLARAGCLFTIVTSRQICVCFLERITKFFLTGKHYLTPPFQLYFYSLFLNRAVYWN